MSTRLAHRLWSLASSREAARFDRACGSVEAVQHGVLMGTLKRNAGTAYGKAHRFAAVRSAGDYRRAVPLATYEDIRDQVQATASGERNVLVSERLRCLEPTSGSSSAGKLIPYTRTLQRQFAAAVAPWVWNMMQRRPATAAGKAYWSISPLARDLSVTEGGIPVGLDNDTAYLHPAVRPLVLRTLAVPPPVACIPDMEPSRFVTLAFLLKAKDLSFVSVWNPSFFSILLNRLRVWLPRLLETLAAGAFSRDVVAGDQLRRALGRDLGRCGTRVTEIERLMSSAGSEQALFSGIWPNLAAVSCWTDAYAQGPAEELQRLLPDVAVLAKGLLATEGVVSVPFGPNERPTLAVRSHYFEFIPEGDPDVVRNAWQLEHGERYEVVMTTGGGLYRYRLGDVVRVTGFHRGCPQLAFVGRRRTVDLFGEKLHEDHVADVLTGAFPRWRKRPGFMLLAPDGQPARSGYTLFLAGEGEPRPGELETLAEHVEAELSRNVHYGYCRRLGQLEKLEVCWVPGGALQAHARYMAAHTGQGRRGGGIKPPLLETGTGWRDALCGAERAGKVLR